MIDFAWLGQAPAKIGRANVPDLKMTGASIRGDRRFRGSRKAAIVNFARTLIADRRFSK
jgi:hypothetical protein